MIKPEEEKEGRRINRKIYKFKLELPDYACFTNEMIDSIRELRIEFLRFLNGHHST